MEAKSITQVRAILKRSPVHSPSVKDKRARGTFQVPNRIFSGLKEISHDDSLKDKFIKHFTGPVEFTSECSQYFFHLYYNTRDCAIPAYYKRCARLLTRLAMSPLCTQP
uniref:ALK and LTK ligand 1 isoform X2 n=1 Tax=Geotrypetes seraphini TaxID=260995 RepID=A0A6P8PN84_GEOSA|nr:ALK and LTK ligand 1 isoform X2 [Geotrypetes seraphini]